VKGNLGTAATTPEGREAVTDAQEEKAAKDELDKIQAALEPARKKKAKAKEDLATVDKIAKVLQTQWDAVWVKSYQTKNDVDGFFKDPTVQALIPKITTIQTKVTEAKKALEDEKNAIRGLKTNLKYKEARQKVEEMETTYKYDIIDLVGTFGPEKVRSSPWYKKIFG
jgi:predicted  nucleic acid-binding Zn-ribbon protein